MDAPPDTIIPTGAYLESEKTLFAVLKIFPRAFESRIVTALSAAKATADLFIMTISAVIPYCTDKEKGL